MRDIDLLFIICDSAPYVCVEAANFADNKHIGVEGFEIVEHLGREKSAIKAFPPMKGFDYSKDSDVSNIYYL